MKNDNNICNDNLMLKLFFFLLFYFFSWYLHSLNSAQHVSSRLQRCDIENGSGNENKDNHEHFLSNAIKTSGRDLFKIMIALNSDLSTTTGQEKEEQVKDEDTRQRATHCVFDLRLATAKTETKAGAALALTHPSPLYLSLRAFLGS